MFSVKDVLGRFADVFNKNPESRLGRLTAILHGQLQETSDTLEKVRAWRSLDAAAGTTLDLIGQNIGQPRGAASDEIYRILIRSKVARNLSKTDMNTIIEVLALALNCDKQDIHIQEKFSDSADPEPAALSLLKVPIKRLNEVGMSPQQFGQIVRKTVAAGVRVAAIELTGTFRLAAKYDVLEQGAAGLSDPAMKAGGTLGEVFAPGNDYALPI